jgi:glycosidase
VRSFCDSNNDGIGDLNGITSKLDYLEDLGIEAIWLTPFFKSPTYHKYDVINYREIDSEYGTMADFERLVSEAHQRNIKIIVDLVINHTSTQHRWFREAKKGSGNPYRNFYNWLTPKKIKELGIARREKTADSFETDPWHWANKGDNEKYYGMFWSGMADLNMNEPQVRREIYDIGKFWLNKGVDGFRMDAAKHIYPDNEMHKTHAFWEEFRSEMETVKPDFYIVGEVWTTAERVAPFFRGLKANFNFDLSYGIQDIVLFGSDSKEIVKMLLKNYAIFERENPDFIDATMLTNHDQNRICSVADGDKEKLKMAANLLLTLPGNPFIYYGEELGMKGVKPDEGIREAFLWDIRKNDRDRTNWRKPKYNTDSRVTPLKQQKTDENSMYNHYRKLIHLRKSQPALGQISPPNLQKSPVSVSPSKLVAFVRPHESGDLLIVQNISNKTVKFKFPEYQEIIHDELSTATQNVVSPFALIIVKVSK